MKRRRGFEFEWDKGNEQKNWTNHQVSKEEQEEAFYDSVAKRVDDQKHSTHNERRFLLYAKTKQGKRLVIAFTIREGRIRPISARPMNRKEVSIYEETITMA